MSHLRTLKTITEKWTTTRGASIEFTVTSLVGDVDSRVDVAISVNGNTMRPLGFSVLNGTNIFKFNARPQDDASAIVISDELFGEVSRMTTDAKAFIAANVAEFNAIEHAERRANRS